MTNIFLDNKYTRWYFSIVKNTTNTGYVEKHHIIPKSLGGNNSKDNIALLTSKQHYICHLLLIKMTEGKNKSKMLMAAWAMGTLHASNHQRHKMNSRTFNKLREDALTNPDRIKNLQEKNKKENNPFYGRTQTDEAKQKMRQAKKGKYTGKDNHFFGKEHSVEVKERISASKKGKTLSEAQKEERRRKMEKYYNDPAVRVARGWKALGVM